MLTTRGTSYRLRRFVEAVALGNIEYDELSQEAREILAAKGAQYPRGILKAGLRDPEDREMNGERARAALRAVEEFANDFGEPPSEDNGVKDQKSALTNLHQNLGDLLCDVAHLCDATGLELQGLLQRARFHYEPETGGKGKQFKVGGDSC